MKLFPLIAATFFFAYASYALAAKAPAQLDEGRCFDIKQSILADLPRFCGKAQADQVRLEDFGHQIDLLEKRCAQPQLAHLFRKALDERVSKESAAGCTAATEKAVKPLSKATASADADEL